MAWVLFRSRLPKYAGRGKGSLKISPRAAYIAGFEQATLDREKHAAFLKAHAALQERSVRLQAEVLEANEELLRLRAAVGKITEAVTTLNEERP